MFLRASLLLVLSALICAYPQTEVATSCDSNEKPIDCVEPCLPTCDVPKRPKCTSHRCVKGCACKEGYIREKDDGKCVPISTCLDSDEISRNYTEPCGDNEVLGECSNCPLTCHGGWLSQCSVEWCVQGCVCKEGYVKDWISGHCITEQECQNKKVSWRNLSLMFGKVEQN